MSSPFAPFDYTHCYCEENVYRLLEIIVSKDELRTQWDAMFAVWMSAYRCDEKNEPRADDPTTWPPPRLLVCQGGTPVVWDYHVVALLRRSASSESSKRENCTLATSGPPARDIIASFLGDTDMVSLWYVVDFDNAKSPQHRKGSPAERTCSSRLEELLVPAHTYFMQTLFSVSSKRYPAANVALRFVPVQEYLSLFRSDRSHMRRGSNWTAPPPHYPCIQGASPTVIGSPKEDEASPAAASSNNVLSFLNMANVSVSPKSFIIGALEMAQKMRRHLTEEDEA